MHKCCVIVTFPDFFIVTIIRNVQMHFVVKFRAINIGAVDIYILHYLKVLGLSFAFLICIMC